jgi:hypothetical protein
MSSRIRRDVVDGVTVFWTPDAARRMGALQFRVGQSDETPPTLGVSHLVEHLALFSTERRSYQFNGSVDPVRTIFYATGSDAELAAFFAQVTARLSALPLERLEAEMRVLRAEAANRPHTLANQHFWHRYGPRGLGLAALREFGLHTLTGPQVSAWAATRFTSGNAVAWYSGPLPDDLHFSLPGGPAARTRAAARDPGAARSNLDRRAAGRHRLRRRADPHGGWGAGVAGAHPAARATAASRPRPKLRGESRLPSHRRGGGRRQHLRQLSGRRRGASPR